MLEESFGSLHPTPFPTGTNTETRFDRVSLEFRLFATALIQCRTAAYYSEPPYTNDRKPIK